MTKFRSLYKKTFIRYRFYAQSYNTIIMFLYKQHQQINRTLMTRGQIFKIQIISGGYWPQTRGSRSPAPTIFQGGSSSRYKEPLHYFTAFLVLCHKVHPLQNFLARLTLSIRQAYNIISTWCLIPHTRRSVFHEWLDKKYLFEPSVCSKEAQDGRVRILSITLKC